MQHKYMASTDFIQHFMYGSKGGKSIKYLVQVYDFPGETGLNLTKLKNENADRKHPRISLVLCLLLLFFLCGGGGGGGGGFPRATSQISPRLCSHVFKTCNSSKWQDN